MRTIFVEETRLERSSFIVNYRHASCSETSWFMLKTMLSVHLPRPIYGDTLQWRPKSITKDRSFVMSLPQQTGRRCRDSRNRVENRKKSFCHCVVAESHFISIMVALLLPVTVWSDFSFTKESIVRWAHAVAIRF